MNLSSFLKEDEPTPMTAPDEFEKLRGQRAKRHKLTKEIWEFDQLHKDHYEVYHTVKDFEKGQRDRAVWMDGRLKEQF